MELSKVQIAKVVNVTTRVIGWALVATVAIVLLYGIFAWATGHFLSFAIVFGIAGGIGVVIAYLWSDEVITKEKEEEEFFQQHGRYETGEERKDRKRREELRSRADRGY